MKRDKEDGWIRLKKNNQVKYQYKKGVESEGKANQEQNEQRHSELFDDQKNMDYDGIEDGSESETTENSNSGPAVTVSEGADLSTLSQDTSGLRRCGRTRNSVEREVTIPYSQIPELITSIIEKVNDEPNGYCGYECIEDQSENTVRTSSGPGEVVYDPDRTAVGWKWVNKKKINKEDRYKARLVAKWYAQQEGIDFTGIFASTRRFKSCRLLIALAAAFNWELSHMDGQTAFLNADMKEYTWNNQSDTKFMEKG